MKADAAVQAAQDEVALLTARFDVRRGELDAVGQRVHRGDRGPEERALARGSAPAPRAARGRPQVARRDRTGRRWRWPKSGATRRSSRCSAPRQVIDSLVMTSPIDGIVSVKENRDASGGFFFFGMVLPEYREGDTVWPGRPVVDVIETGRMEVRAKVDETDRDEPHVGRAGAGPGRHASRRSVQGHGRRALGARLRAPRSSRRASVTRQFDITLPVRTARRTAEGRLVARASSSTTRRFRTRSTCRARRSSRRTARHTSS